MGSTPLAFKIMECALEPNIAFVFTSICICSKKALRLQIVSYVRYRRTQLVACTSYTTQQDGVCSGGHERGVQCQTKGTQRHARYLVS